jgi:hypothetical protein
LASLKGTGFIYCAVPKVDRPGKNQSEVGVATGAKITGLSSWLMSMRNAVDYLYSLYDALVSINVPNDKARAVVDAMERDMATTIATKADLHLLKQELTALINASVGELRQETALIRNDMEILSTTMTIRLGSMLAVGFGVMIAALKFLQG